MADQEAKCQASVSKLEATLAKRNKEILALKKNGECLELSKLADSIQMVRGHGKNTTERVKQIATTLSKANEALKVLENDQLANKTSTTSSSKSDEDHSVEKYPTKDALVEASKHGAERVTAAKQLDILCQELQSILKNDSLIPRPVIQMDVSDKVKRNELIEKAIETAMKWADGQENQCAMAKSNVDLENLCCGLENVASSLRGLNDCQKLTEPLPDLANLIKVAAASCSSEIKNNKKKHKDSEGLVNVMSSLAKAITICIHVRELLDISLDKANKVCELVEE